MCIRIVSTLMLFVLIFSGCYQIYVAKSGADEGTRSMTFYAYHSYAEVREELIRISNEHEDIADLRILGQTYEGRDILALRVTDNPQIEELDEPSVLIMGAHHANELPSTEVPMYILEYLIGNYSSNGTARMLVDNRDIWFVPLLNPDGREYVLNGATNWRKNRQPIDLNGDGTPEGYGVDLNRNYAHHWGQLPGTSHDLNDRDYCGPAPFSENETRAIRDLAYGQLFEISLSYHTYGEVIFYPWNNNIDTISPQGTTLEAVASEIAVRTGYTPTQGVTPPLGYPTTGDSDDWLYANTSCLPFTIELSTTFQPPASEIENLCENNLDAALYAIDIADGPGRALLPDWTFMVYMAADNDLDDDGRENINEMEVSGSTGDVNVIVLFDGQFNGDSKLYRVLNDPGGFNTTIISEELDDQGEVINPITSEVDTSDPSTLRAFVNWTIENYPAQHYLLDFWGHGRGILGGCCIDGMVPMQTNEIRPALTGFELDIVGFDACSMGNFETAHELMGIADYLIGSEEDEPVAGWDYESSLLTLTGAPNMAPRELATIIVSDYLDKNTNVDYITQCALDMHVFQETFLPLLNDFVNVCLDFVYYDFDYIWQVRNSSDTFSVMDQNEPVTIDLYDFLTNLEESDIAEPVKRRIDRLQEIEEWLIVTSGHGYTHPTADTMAIYFPPMDVPISPVYEGLSFFDELWDEYLAELKNPSQTPRITSLDLPEMDNTTGPYILSAEMTAPNQTSLTLFFRVDGGAWQSKPMAASSSVFSCALDGQPNGTVIDFYFTATFGNRQITQPYEVKWGEEDYYNVTVLAYCDVAVTRIVAVPDTPTNNTLVNFTITCRNLGLKSVTANVSLILQGAGENILVGWEILALAPGAVQTVMFNWTTVVGIWTLSANATALGVEDTNLNNQNETIWLNVTASYDISQTAGYLLLFLIVFSFIPFIAIIMVFRRARQRRRASAVRSLRLTRYFIRTAEDFDVDASSSYLLLAKAEAALARGAFDEAERLAGKAKESAIIAVGEQKK